MLRWGEASIELMYRDRAWVEIDVAAIAHNIRELRRLLAPETELMTVVKADAYGHGAITVAKAALQAGAAWLGVATIPEGIELRKAGLTAPILVLGATNTADQVESLRRWHLIPSLCTPKQALIFSEVLGDRRHLPVHLMFDTGMSRLGTRWEEAQAFVQLVRRLPNLTIAGVYSHCATADDPDPTVMQLQHQRFEQILDECDLRRPSYKIHFANSAALISDRQLHYDMARSGLATYGLYPAPHLRSRLDLRPALQVKARITQIKQLPAGTGVSYGHRFVSDRDMTLAVIGIGYADGVPRCLSNQMTVSINGQAVRQVGAITMDQIMLDVTDVPQIQEGDVVTLLGQDGEQVMTADDWAEKLGTISWEILCGFKNRLPRVTVNAGYDQNMTITSAELTA
jgi:alanine racemase